MSTVKAKKVKESKTVWVGALVTALGTIVAVIPQLVPFVNEKIAGILLALSGIATIVLRFFTTQPVAVGGEQDSV
jgi:hypothetical protein